MRFEEVAASEAAESKERWGVMELWRKVWREGIAPVMRLHELQSLRRALMDDDSRLTQETTCVPSYMPGLVERCEECCALAFGEIGRSTKAADSRFAQICDECNAVMDDRVACQHFLNWYDDTPRNEMRRELLAEVTRFLAGKK